MSLPDSGLTLWPADELWVRTRPCNVPFAAFNHLLNRVARQVVDALKIPALAGIVENLGMGVEQLEHDVSACAFATRSQNLVSVLVNEVKEKSWLFHRSADGLLF